MRNYVTLALCLIFVGCTSVGSTPNVNRPPITYSEGILPSMVIAYNLALVDYDNFRCLWNSRIKDQNTHPFLKLESQFEKLSPNINVSFGFTYLSYIIQNDIRGQISGFTPVEDKDSGELKVPFENMLFVTTPIQSFGNRILVFLSSVSPQNTIIMDIDSKLNVELLYTTFVDKINKISYEQSYTIMCSIFSIRVKEPGLFVLYERENSRCTIQESKRTFCVDVRSGKFKISVESSKP